MRNSRKVTPNEVAIKDRTVVAIFVDRNGMALPSGLLSLLLEVVRKGDRRGEDKTSSSQ
jgi:hypothetical protein